MNSEFSLQTAFPVSQSNPLLIELDHTERCSGCIAQLLLCKLACFAFARSLRQSLSWQHKADQNAERFRPAQHVNLLNLFPCTHAIAQDEANKQKKHNSQKALQRGFFVVVVDVLQHGDGSNADQHRKREFQNAAKRSVFFHDIRRGV